MRRLRLILRSQRGSVLAFTTISMVVMISFSAGVMDIGSMYETRRQLQNGADGAALAGAQALAVTGSIGVAVNTALDYAQRNGISVSQVDAGFPLITSEGPYTNNAVRVSATRHLNLLVASLFGNGVGDVNALATAVIAPMLPADSVWPWGVPEDDVQIGQKVALKVGASPPDPGNFRPLDFLPFGGGANDYEEDVRTGYGNTPGDYISGSLPWLMPTQTGNVAGPTRQGIDYLLGAAASSGQDDVTSPWNEPNDTCTWTGAPLQPSDPDVPPPSGWVGSASACYRIGIIPIIDSFDVNGRGEVSIVGWAAFYLIGYAHGPGGLTDVWGYFLEKAYVSGGRTNWGAPMSGLIGVRLWR